MAKSPATAGAVPGRPDTSPSAATAAGRRAEVRGSGIHGREPEPLDEILDCLAYVQAVQDGNEENALAAFDILHLRLAGRADAMVAPLKLASLIAAEAAKRGCAVDAVLAGVRDQVLAGRGPRDR
jgi:hypothetical protein